MLRFSFTRIQKVSRTRQFSTSRDFQVIAEDQSETIEFLSDPATYGLRSGKVETIETHGAFVFLAGERAYKLKRAVKFEYMDFSTVDRRRAVCETEILVNRRTAPEIYLGVMAVVRIASGNLALNAPDTSLEDSDIVDWVVEMVRFEDDSLFDRMAEQGRLTAEVMTALADQIVQFHGEAEVRPDMGGCAAHRAVIDTNHKQFLRFLGTVFDKNLAESVTKAAREELERCGGEIERRREAGLVRHCHGDMHLRNIFMFKGVPTLFDAIEFDEKIACVDVLYDLAFLLMDLIERGLTDIANQLFNRYLSHVAIPDLWRMDGLKCLPLFLSCRAGIRAHVNASTAAAQTDDGAGQEYIRKARKYLAAAARYLESPSPYVVAVGGLSGVGKSALAGWLSPKLGRPPGALWVRSDVVRKRLLGKDPLENLGPEAYLSEVNELVYRTMLEMVERAVRAGQSVVVDAVFAREDERLQVASGARLAGADFEGLWLEAPREELTRRIRNRRDDASDATVDVLERQLKYDLGKLGWIAVDASGSAEKTRETAHKALEGWLDS